ncbi:MAG: glycosyltransferase family 4 protein [Acidobacteriota bacterium]
MSPPRDDLPGVLLLAPYLPPEGGAAAARLAGLAEQLAALGHRIFVVAPQPSYFLPEGSAVREREEGVIRVPLGRRGSGPIGNAWSQLRLLFALRAGAQSALECFEPDVVLVSSPPPLAALAGHGLRGKGGRQLPLVLDLRDLWPDVLVEAGIIGDQSPVTGFLRFVERRMLSGATRVTTVTRTKVERLRERLTTEPVLVSNGIDPDWLSGEPSYGGGDDDDFEILHAGNVGRPQDLGVLVEALAIARRSGAPLRATLVGGGEDLPRVRRRAEELGLPITFIAPEPRESIKQRLARCGCAFSSLRTEELVDAVPSKVFEALSLGVPIVLSAAGESARVVEESGGGVVVSPGRPAELAKVLVELAASGPEHRAELGRTGREHVSEHYRREVAAQHLSGLLREIVAPS